MKNAGYGVAIVGVVLVLVSLLNHFVLKMNPTPHTSTWIAGAGAVVAVIGLILIFMGNRATGAAS